MSKPLIKLFEIQYIQKNFIYLKDKRILAIFTLANGKHTNDKMLETIVASFENPWHILTTKRNACFEDYESYFSSLLTKNLTSPLLAELLLYIQNFKSSCTSFSQRKMYLILEIITEDEGKNLNDLITSYGFIMQPVEATGIATLLQDICT